MTEVIPSTRAASTDRRGDHAASSLRFVGIGLLAASLACIVLLHFLRRDLAPARHRISEYALGPHGELMAAAFVCLGAGVLALAWPLARAVARRSRLVLAVATSSGVGMVISGIFRTDPERSGVTTDAIHSYASAISTMALIGTTLLCSVGNRELAPRLQRVTVGLAVLGAILGALSPFLHHSSWTGVSQRLLWLTLLAWLILTGLRLPARTTKWRRTLL
jgi:uncharacterized protein DUF998